MKPRKQLMNGLRFGWSCFVAEHDGDMWLANSFWLVRCDAATSHVKDLLAEFNLPLEPMRLAVGRTIIRSDDDPPPVEHIVNGQWSDVVTPYLINGRRVRMAKASTNGWLDVWTAGSEMIHVDPDVIGIPDMLHADGKWHASNGRHGGSRRLVKVHEGRVLAVVATASGGGS